MNYNNSRLNAMIRGGQWQPNYHCEMLDTYNQQAHRHTAITILAGISSRNHYFVCEERLTSKLRKYMIAKIYPDGHPDLQGKKDPTHPVRYFDIRKLTPVECYSLMGVPPQQIETLMQTEKKPYMAFVGVDAQLAVFGLEPSATMKEVEEAYREALDSLTARADNADEEEDLDEDTARIMAQESEDNTEENALLQENYEMAYRSIIAAPREERFGDVQVIANSSHYKLAGNSIVCDVLMYIYEELLYPTGRRLNGEVQDLFALPQFRLQRDWKKDPLRLVTLCSGYDSQAIAMDMLKQRYHDFDYRLVAWSEFDPESNRPLEEQPAVVAHNLLFPQCKDLNRGDMTKADWSDLKDAQIDLLTYSTPCQSISQAGKREGIKKGSGTRSAVLWSTEEAVKTMRPKVLLQENVRALINSVNMPDFKEWCQLLESHGYVNFLAPSFPTPWGTDKRDRHTIPGILNAKHYGVPQNRERVYMVSIRADLLQGTQYEFPRPFELDRCIADILEDDVDERFFLKPDSVIKFLTVNEQTDGNDIHYLVTDHKLSDEEIAKARSSQ